LDERIWEEEKGAKERDGEAGKTRKDRYRRKNGGGQNARREKMVAEKGKKRREGVEWENVLKRRR
jgi:hypothetical protein